MTVAGAASPEQVFWEAVGLSGGGMFSPPISRGHPSLKLLSKTRKGSKTIRKYGPPQTPYQRLIQSEHLSPEQKQKLQSQFHQLNPLRLKEQIEQQLKWVFATAQAGKADCESTT